MAAGAGAAVASPRPGEPGSIRPGRPRSLGGPSTPTGAAVTDTDIDAASAVARRRGLVGMLSRALGLGVEAPPERPSRPAERAAAAATGEVPVVEPKERRRLRRTQAEVVAEPRPDPAPTQPAWTAYTELPPAPRRSFHDRFAVVYDVDGPRIRLGLGWAALVAVALLTGPVRPYALAVVFGGAAGMAAFQIVECWRDRYPGADPWLAAAGAAILSVAGAVDVRVLGIATMLLVVIALVAAILHPGGGIPIVASAGQTVLAAGPVGMAAASVAITARYEIGAVIVLVVLVGVYEASDYIVGSGAASSLEGPLAGIIAMAAVTLPVVFLEVTPWRGADAWLFTALAAVCCPIGQLVASGLLPDPDSPAPALRRIDSFLVLGPLWAWLLGLYLTA